MFWMARKSEAPPDALPTAGKRRLLLVPTSHEVKLVPTSFHTYPTPCLPLGLLIIPCSPRLPRLWPNLYPCRVPCPCRRLKNVSVAQNTYLRVRTLPQMVLASAREHHAPRTTHQVPCTTYVSSSAAGRERKTANEAVDTGPGYQLQAVTRRGIPDATGSRHKGHHSGPHVSPLRNRPCDLLN